MVTIRGTVLEVLVLGRPSATGRVGSRKAGSDAPGGGYWTGFGTVLERRRDWISICGHSRTWHSHTAASSLGELGVSRFAVDRSCVVDEGLGDRASSVLSRRLPASDPSLSKSSWGVGRRHATNPTTGNLAKNQVGKGKRANPASEAEARQRRRQSGNHNEENRRAHETTVRLQGNEGGSALKDKREWAISYLEPEPLVKGVWACEGLLSFEVGVGVGE